MQVFDDPHARSYARLTGLFYLGIAVCGVFSIAYVPSQIVVAGNPAATLANIVQRSGLYHLGIAADVLLMVFEVMALSMLYVMFKSVSPTLSFAAAMARLGMVIVMAAMLFFHAGAESLASLGDTPTAFSFEQRAELAGLLLGMHHAGVWIWQVFFATHLVLLGYLVVASGRFPRLLGYGLVVGAFGYLLDSVYAFAFSDLAALGILRAVLLAVVTVSEIGFALWLLIKGPRPAAESGQLAHA